LHAPLAGRDRLEESTARCGGPPRLIPAATRSPCFPSLAPLPARLPAQDAPPPDIHHRGEGEPQPPPPPPGLRRFMRAASSTGPRAAIRARIGATIVDVGIASLVTHESSLPPEGSDGCQTGVRPVSERCQRRVRPRSDPKPRNPNLILQEITNSADLCDIRVNIVTGADRARASPRRPRYSESPARRNVDSPSSIASQRPPSSSVMPGTSVAEMSRGVIHGACRTAQSI
jgi:hypothetical protein